MTNTDYVAKTFQKGDVTEVAHTARQAVDLKFRGFAPVEETDQASAEKEPAYAELQEQARSLNATENHSIKLNASYDDLLKDVTEAAQFEADLAAAEASA